LTRACFGIVNATSELPEVSASVASANPLTLMGAAGSPYTRKMVALLRYRRIQHAVIWASHRNPRRGVPGRGGKAAADILYFPKAEGGHQAVVDSTPIIRRLEAEHQGRSAYPSILCFAFLNYSDRRLW